MFKSKNVLLGVTGSIAAYKSTYLIRIFKKLGASVRVIQTTSYLEFVTTLSLSTLSESKVYIDMIDKDSKEWNNHVDLALWADIMVIAPASAKTISKMAEGNCDNLLIACYLSSKCPVYFAPAMDLDMYKHDSTVSNINKLIKYGDKFIPSKYGDLASGLIGEGRMSEPEEIVDFIINDINSSQLLYNKKCLVTAGPTHEMIDPVRYINNGSSGKMGMFIAEELANRGAIVDLIMGPSILLSTHPNINQINVISADDMFNKVEDKFIEKDILVFSAAVSDYSPESYSKDKIKKQEDSLNLFLKKNKDILKEVSLKKTENQTIVGFALETNNPLENAKNKLKNKNLDLIVLNILDKTVSPIDSDKNKISIIDRDFNVKKFSMKHKKEVAVDIVDEIIKLRCND